MPNRLPMQSVAGGLAVLLFLLLPPFAGGEPPASGEGVLELELLGRYDGGDGKEAAEIAAWDGASRRLFVVNGATRKIDVLDLSDPRRPSLAFRLDVGSLGAPNSVAVHDGLVAVAVAAPTPQDDGKVAFFDRDGQDLGSVTVGALPDMVAFSPDGKRLLVANEGEPDDGYRRDPPGSISLITIAVGAPRQEHVATLTFTDFDAGGPRAVEVPPGLRIRPKATVSQDLEPEYIAFDAAGSKAWVALQENNAFAILDLATPRVETLVDLGSKDHSRAGAGLDASDRDGGVEIRPWPVAGLYQPDAIAAFEVAGETFLVSANEGDARKIEERRVGDLKLDRQVFRRRGKLQKSKHLGRLQVSAHAEQNGAGAYRRLFSFGARSMSVWDARGSLLWDSGDQLERAVTAIHGATHDHRSDNKGPEPEGIAVGRVGERHYAFVGLERAGGIAVFDVSEPTAPVFDGYHPSPAEDVSPEGVTFIPWTSLAQAGPDSATSPAEAPPEALLVVPHEISGTVVIWGLRRAAR
ncbi:MAG: choice-of-anchor I family protein [Acidobacteriota bacterium]